MKYYKAIEETNYGNNGNYYSQSRYEIIKPNNKKIYICGYDVKNNNERVLEIELSENFSDYSSVLIYKENYEKKHKEFIFSYDYNENKEIYDTIGKMFSIKFSGNNASNINNETICSLM